MTQRISRTQGLIISQLLKHQQGTLIPRGLAIPMDKFLAGEQRFARPLGSNFPVLTPRNTMRLSAQIRQGEVVLYVNELLPSIPIGSIISFHGEELQFVEDVDTDNNLIRISSEDGFLADYSTNTPVYLHAVPATMELAASSGDTALTISLDFIMVHGDVLTEVLTEGVGGSAVDVNTSDVVAVSELGPYIYNLTLERGVLQDYSVGDTIYLRAFPGYKSQILPMPTQPGILGENIGPFLVDHLEGRLHDGVDNPATGEPDPETFLATTTYNPAFIMMTPRTIRPKNSVNTGAVIPSHFFGLWNRHLGTLLYQGDNTTITVDEDGDFLVSHSLVPEWPANVDNWYAAFMSTEDVEIKIGFHLSENPGSSPTLPAAPPGSTFSYSEDLQTIFLTFNVIGGLPTATSILVRAPGYAFDKLTIGGYSEVAGCVVTLREWHPFGGIATWIEYTIMGRVQGEYSWASSGLLVKPIFLTRDHMRQTDQMDTGLVMF